MLLLVAFLSTKPGSHIKLQQNNTTVHSARAKTQWWDIYDYGYTFMQPVGFSIKHAQLEIWGLSLIGGKLGVG